MAEHYDRMEEKQGMRHIPTEKEKQKKWDRITAVLNNLKDWSWDVIPQYKIEKEDAEVIIEALERQRINIMLPQMTSAKVDAKTLDKWKEQVEKNFPTMFKGSPDE